MNTEEGVTITVEKDSWIVPYAYELKDKIEQRGLTVLVCESSDILSANGWINFLLGLTKRLPNSILTLHKHNLVIHESDLPQGKGFSPMSWQILEGKNSIPFCLFEATEEIDSGPIWLKETVQLNGSELASEWRDIQGKVTIELCLRFIDEYPSLKPLAQKGKGSFYSRRLAKDSKLDVNKTIYEQFNLLRIVDNERYPAFFEINGNKYYLNIYKEKG